MRLQDKLRESAARQKRGDHANGLIAVRESIENHAKHLAATQRDLAHLAQVMTEIVSMPGLDRRPEKSLGYVVLPASAVKRWREKQPQRSA